MTTPTNEPAGPDLAERIAAEQFPGHCRLLDGVTSRRRYELAERIRREFAASPELAQVREALRPFASVARQEQHTEAGESVMVNVDRCRDAQRALAALQCITGGQP